MDSIIYLVFRNMRRPLLTLLATYSLSVLGLTLIPGQDADGNTWHMGFFHAFYFVSFMSTTIGFGEIPHEFNDLQRMWVLFSIYATVISWIYAIGTLLTLIRDNAFQQALTVNSFGRRIKRIAEPFVLVCGYGSVGQELVQDLTNRHQRVVVLDNDKQHLDLLQLNNLREFVPSFIGDAETPEILKLAGLRHPMCTSVVALTKDNDANLKIAITSKLLEPKKTVLCRADSIEVERNMESFGTDYIVDPFETFAQHLSVALQAPGLYLLREWLTGISQDPLASPVSPPQNGKWLLCGYGRFGKSVYKKLTQEGLEVVVIEATPEKTGEPKGGSVHGKGTEAPTLLEAGVEQAVGLVAGTDRDVDNLSIIMTARELNPELFVILRQNRRANQSLVEEIHADMIMLPSQIIANRIRVLLATPLLHEFIKLAKGEEDDWACELVSRIIGISSEAVPEVWQTEINDEEAYAVNRALSYSGHPITIGNLMSNPNDRDRKLPVIPLLLIHNNTKIILPRFEQKIAIGDKILWCGRINSHNAMAWTLNHALILENTLYGEVRQHSLVWRRIERWYR